MAPLERRPSIHSLTRILASSCATSHICQANDMDEITDPSAFLAAILDQADILLERKEYTEATKLADNVLGSVDRSVLARAALIRGKSLLDPLLSQIMYR